MENIHIEREFGRAFYLAIPLDLDDSSCQELVLASSAVERVVAQVSNGEFSIWEGLEAIEDAIASVEIDMDQYCDEVEQNLYESLLILPDLVAKS